MSDARAQHRTACCACGALSVIVNGDPTFVAICNCTQCQRRTGSVYGVSAYFDGGQIVEIAGASKLFTRGSDAGRSVEIRFCSECGSSVYWTGSGAPVTDGIGIAAGCFADPEFPEPEVVAWCAHKYTWAKFPPDAEYREGQD